MQNTAIEWTNHTWNPWLGCLKVSPGCKQCYMYAWQERYGQNPKDVRRAAKATFNSALTFRAWAACSWVTLPDSSIELSGRCVPLINVAPLSRFAIFSDFFIEHADAWRPEAWGIIRATPHLTYQILTKRPQNIANRLPADWGDGYPNVWLGVSVETEQYTSRLDILSSIPALVRFVSYEPALGPVDFSPWLASGSLHWIISGGESGSGCRPANPDWFRAVRDQCVKYGVAYFHKQNGGNKKIDGSKGGHLLDGQAWRQFPVTSEAPAHNAQLALFGEVQP